MKRQIHAFISASSEQQDRKVLEWFFRILEEHNVEPIFATEFPEPRPPPDKIKDFIQKSDVFIAIITKRDKIEGKNLWKGPEWVQNEIGMEVQQEKPFALFIEKGVDPNQGIGRWKTEYVLFGRENLRKIESDVEKLVEALKKQVINVVETQAIEEAIIEEPETSSFKEGVISLGRLLIERIYGRLDVNLWKIYTILALLSIPSAYSVYDYIMGYKIVGLWGYAICPLILIVSLAFVSLVKGTKCRKCGSYFSVRERPVLASDMKNLPRIPDTRRYHKRVCDVRGNPTYQGAGMTGE